MGHEIKVAGEIFTILYYIFVSTVLFNIFFWVFLSEPRHKVYTQTVIIRFCIFLNMFLNIFLDKGSERGKEMNVQKYSTKRCTNIL